MEQMALDGEGHFMKDEHAPGMLSRPVEPPPPLPHSYDLPALQTLRQVVANRQAKPDPALRPRLRAWASHVSGRADRRLLNAATAAQQELAEQCDLLVDRLAAQEVVTSDLARVYGEELARLRAEVSHLSRVTPAPGDEVP